MGQGRDVEIGKVLAEVGANEGATAHHGLVSCGLLEGDGLLSLLLGDLELVTGGEEGGGETVQKFARSLRASSSNSRSPDSSRPPSVLRRFPQRLRARLVGRT